MFNINTVSALAEVSAKALIEQIKAKGFDHDHILEHSPGTEFKVFIQRGQINCALCSESLRKWLDTFFVEGGDDMNPFESEFFNTVYEFAQKHPLFMDVEHIHTQMWIVGETDTHSPNAVLYAYAEVDTNYETPDYDLLEKVMKSAYGLMIITDTWLGMKQGAEAHSQPIRLS